MPFMPLVGEELSKNLGIGAMLEGFAIPVCWTLFLSSKNSWSGSICCHWGLLEQQEISISSVPGSSQGSLHGAAPLRAPPALGCLQEEARLDSFSPQ